MRPVINQKFGLNAVRTTSGNPAFVGANPTSRANLGSGGMSIRTGIVSWQTLVSPLNLYLGVRGNSGLWRRNSRQ